MLLGLPKSLPPDSQKFESNSLAQNDEVLLLRTCSSDGFGFLLFDGETVGPGAGRLRNQPIINDKKQTNMKQSCKKTIANTLI